MEVMLRTTTSDKYDELRETAARLLSRTSPKFSSGSEYVLVDVLVELSVLRMKEKFDEC